MNLHYSTACIHCITSDDGPIGPALHEISTAIEPAPTHDGRGIGCCESLAPRHRFSYWYPMED